MAGLRRPAFQPIAKSQSERQRQRLAGSLNAAASKWARCPVVPSSGQRKPTSTWPAPLDDELLNRSWIVSCGDRGAEAADRPILVKPEPAVGRGHPNKVSGCVIGYDEGPELAFTPVIALTRHRPGRQTRRQRRRSARRMRPGRDRWDISLGVPIGVEGETMYTIRRANCESAKFPHSAFCQGGGKRRGLHASLTCLDPPTATPAPVFKGLVHVRISDARALAPSARRLVAWAAEDPTTPSFSDEHGKITIRLTGLGA